VDNLTRLGVLRELSFDRRRPVREAECYHVRTRVRASMSSTRHA
jgi:hypothetical protein